MLVKDIVATPVTTCTVKATVGDVRDLMKLKKFSAVPVVHVHNDTVDIKGILSYHDLAGVYDDSISVQQVMTTDVAIVSPGISVREAAKKMVSNQIHHLLVVENDDIIGIISSFDFVKLIAESPELG